MLPFFREPDLAATVDSGFALDAVWNDGALHNYGAMAGVLGNIMFIDYRLEFRYSTASSSRASTGRCTTGRARSG